MMKTLTEAQSWLAKGVLIGKYRYTPSKLRWILGAESKVYLTAIEQAFEAGQDSMLKKLERCWDADGTFDFDRFEQIMKKYKVMKP